MLLTERWVQLRPTRQTPHVFPFISSRNDADKGGSGVPILYQRTPRPRESPAKRWQNLCLVLQPRPGLFSSSAQVATSSGLGTGDRAGRGRSASVPLPFGASLWGPRWMVGCRAASPASTHHMPVALAPQGVTNTSICRHGISGGKARPRWPAPAGYGSVAARCNYHEGPRQSSGHRGRGAAGRRLF